MSLVKRLDRDQNPGWAIGKDMSWTGSVPQCGQCAGVGNDGKIRSLPQLSLDAPRQSYLDYFDNSWALTEVLFSGLNCVEAYYRRPYHQLRHPLIFYFAHPLAVYINKLRVAGLVDKPLHAEFERLFEVGVDEMRWDDLHEGDPNIWPDLAEVFDYRRQGYQLIRNLIATTELLADDRPKITQNNPIWALVMGFEHERIHLETSSVLMRELPLEFVRQPDAWPASLAVNSGRPAPENKMMIRSACEVVLGKPDDWPSFGWDNEYGTDQRQVATFAASQYLISNGEFLKFVQAGGYGDPTFWSEDGWGWRRFRNVKWPSFWVQDGPAGSHLYKLRTIFQVIDMQPDWPVAVNFHEAKAYCRWRSLSDPKGARYRLLTEAEHQALRTVAVAPSTGAPIDPVMAASGCAAQFNLNFHSGSESPVDHFPPNQHGFSDVFGNVWQWCEDHFHPLPQSQPHPYYDDFSAPCYDGEHQMILGGSFISTGDEASIWSRFHFRPHFFQHAGFRLVQIIGDEDKNLPVTIKKQEKPTYETDDMVRKYLLMHYGSESDIWDQEWQTNGLVPKQVHLPSQIADLVIEHTSAFARVLDLGCAVGRSSFELARRFDHVVGIDYSHAFIDAARHLQRDGKMPYQRLDVGGRLTSLEAKVADDIDRNRVSFEWGDAMDLAPNLGAFDAVLMSNLLCRLPDPKKLLARLQGPEALVRSGGVVVMATPFSWLEEYTPKDNWLADVPAVADLMPEYQLVAQKNWPFMIRDHRRRFEYIITAVSVWRRRG